MVRERASMSRDTYIACIVVLTAGQRKSNRIVIDDLWVANTDREVRCNGTVKNPYFHPSLSLQEINI